VPTPRPWQLLGEALRAGGCSPGASAPAPLGHHVEADPGGPLLRWCGRWPLVWARCRGSLWLTRPLLSRRGAESERLLPRCSVPASRAGPRSSCCRKPARGLNSPLCFLWLQTLHPDSPISTCHCAFHPWSHRRGGSKAPLAVFSRSGFLKSRHQCWFLTVVRRCGGPPPP